jgi:hypothetical protein
MVPSVKPATTCRPEGARVRLVPAAHKFGRIHVYGENMDENTFGWDESNDEDNTHDNALVELEDSNKIAAQNK